MSYIDVVFDGPPSHYSGRFVEVEDEHGRSIAAGKWINRENGFWALQFNTKEVTVTSNITKEHEGKHGVLTLGEANIKGTITDVYPDDGLRIQVSGTTCRMILHFDDGWQFTPDPDPLPTEPGWYMCMGDVGGPEPVLHHLTINGEWYSHWGSGATRKTAHRMAEFHAADPLVRVSFGVAS